VKRNGSPGNSTSHRRQPPMPS
jgi:hypothetical protein